MDILRISLAHDLWTKCQEYKEEKGIVDETFDSWLRTKIQEAVDSVDLTSQTTINDTTCMARIWNKGHGHKQCTNKRKEGEYCGHHMRMLAYEGVLRFGHIREQRPEHDLIKLKNGSTHRLHWLHPDPLVQLQHVLDRQALKVIVSTPTLVLN
jgi:hypothetical protein